MKLLLVGATGLIGQAALQQALAGADVSQVIAPTRRPLPAHARLLNPQVDFDALPVEAAWWAVDAVVCTLGTTLRAAGSRAAFRKVDHDYPLAVARHALRHGARTYVLTSASGADPDSRIFYSRTKGEVERALALLGYRSLTFVRPALLAGERSEHRFTEQLGIRIMGAMGPILPRRLRVVPAERVATALLQAARSALPGQHVVESEQLQPD